MRIDDLTSAVALYHKGNAMRAYALLQIHDNAMWEEGGYDSFKDFYEDGLKISESTAHRLLRYARLLQDVGLSIWTADSIPSEGALRSIAGDENAQDLYHEALELVDGDPGKITKRIADEVAGSRNKSSNRKRPDKRPVDATVADSLRGLLFDRDTRLCPDGKAHEFIDTFKQKYSTIPDQFDRQLHAEIQNAEAVMNWLDDYARNLRAKSRTALQAVA